MKVIKENERQKIILIEKDGKKFIEKRIHDDKWEFYEMLKKINHPNIPKIINVDFASDTVVTEEYIEGKSLNTLMDEKYVFSKKLIKSIVNQIISAISELHKHNIIHRDIKPDNIIMNESGHIWLIDYDIARIYRDEIRKDTEAMGTFGYAPIEQYGMMPTDFKTDIYAFGVTLMKLLEYSGIKGSLYKIAEKCKRLDPSQRYQNVQQLKKAISLNGISRIIFASLGTTAILVLLAILSVSVFRKEPLTKEDIRNIQDGTAERPKGYVEVDDEVLALLNFEGFEMSETHRKFLDSEFSESADIFSVEELWAHLMFIEDTKSSGIIYLGKGKETNVNAEIELKNGVLSVNLNDGYGHSFSRDFSYNPDNAYTLTYTDNRRQNAELICRDLDGDYIEELLIGVNDCSFKMADNKVFCYFNYSQAWCLKYDESRGFTLCEGEMFADNGKFAFLADDLNVYLPVYTITEDGRRGYQLKGNQIVPFY